jgi:hypothetical protein
MPGRRSGEWWGTNKQLPCKILIMSGEKKIQGQLITRQGEFTYEYFQFYNKTHHFDTYAFMIWYDRTPEKEKADMSLLIMKDGVHLKVIDLMMNDYKGKGIAIAIVLECRNIFRKRIISSSNNSRTKCFTSEANWPEAIARVWQPLTEQGLAVYDQLNDQYVLIDV